MTAKKDFWQKGRSPNCTLGVKNVVEIALSGTISEVIVSSAEIQDGWQKWQEKNFWKNIAS